MYASFAIAPPPKTKSRRITISRGHQNSRGSRLRGRDFKTQSPEPAVERIRESANFSETRSGYADFVCPFEPSKSGTNVANYGIEKPDEALFIAVAFARGVQFSRRENSLVFRVASHVWLGSAKKLSPCWNSTKEKIAASCVYPSWPIVRRPAWPLHEGLDDSLSVFKSPIRGQFSLRTKRRGVTKMLNPSKKIRSSRVIIIDHILQRSVAILAHPHPLKNGFMQSVVPPDHERNADRKA